MKTIESFESNMVYSEDLLGKVAEVFGKKSDVVKEFKKGRTMSLARFFALFIEQEQLELLSPSLIKEVCQVLPPENAIEIFSRSVMDICDLIDIYCCLMQEWRGGFYGLAELSKKDSFYYDFIKYQYYPLKAEDVKKIIEENSPDAAVKKLEDIADEMLSTLRFSYLNKKPKYSQSVVDRVEKEYGRDSVEYKAVLNSRHGWLALKLIHDRFDEYKKKRYNEQMINELKNSDKPFIALHFLRTIEKHAQFFQTLLDDMHKEYGESEEKMERDKIPSRRDVKTK